MFSKRAREIILKATLLGSASAAGFAAGPLMDHQQHTAYARSLYMTTESVVLKTAMNGEGSDVVVIPANEAVNVESVHQNQAWANVSWKGNRGYLHTMYLELRTVSDAAPANDAPAQASDNKQSYRKDGFYRFTTQETALRTRPSAAANTLKALPKGSDVLLIDEAGTYYQVYAEGTYGWVLKAHTEDYPTASASLSAAKKPQAQASPVVEKVQTTVWLNLRAAAGTQHRILTTLAPKVELQVLRRSGGWLQVISPEGQGWVHSDFVARLGSPSPQDPGTALPPKTLKTSTALNLRGGAGTSYEILGTVPAGTRVSATAESGSWYFVSVNGRTGWMHKDYLLEALEPSTPDPNPLDGVFPGESLRPDGYHMVARRTADLYLGAGTSYPKTGSASKGTDFLIIDQQKDWLQVYTGGSYRWTQKENLTDYGVPGNQADESQRPVVVLHTTEYVNFRAGEGLNFPIRGVLPPNTQVTLLSRGALFHKVHHNGRDGYIHKDYLKDASKPVNPTPSEPSNPGISQGIRIAPVGPKAQEDIPIQGSTEQSVSRLKVFLNGSYLNDATLSGRSFSYVIPANITRPGTNRLRLEGSSPSGALVGETTFQVNKRPIIVLDAGHGGVDPGAVYPFEGRILQEKEYAFRYTNALKNELSALGFQVIMTRTGDYDLELSERVDVARRYNADLLLSIHHNAGPPAAYGGLTLYPSTMKNPSTQAAQSESRDISELFGKAYENAGMYYRGAYRDVDVTGHTLYLTRNAQSRSILTEVGFLSNASDAQKVTSKTFQQRFPKELAQQIYDFFYRHE
ncbi:N-acetylmuramoyl-L-alanine amidase [Clostridiaceae bacterium JG1575]|nr:N-acetylmuramoyl-L-alanine amidase [Clostridiaceae bacterium JG1575]